MVPTQIHDFKRRLCTQIQYNYASWKRLICLKYILNNLSTILHTQFNLHTLPVTPFKNRLLAVAAQRF